MEKIWRLEKRRDDDLLRHLLLTRGLETEAAAAEFLNPDYERDLHDPFLFSEMERAAERIWRAVRSNEKTLIFADYDADGVPGAVILSEFLRRAGLENFQVYFPDRQREAYGLSLEGIRRFAAAGFSLVITIDCGISNVAEVELAGRLGVDVIITDHHLAQATLPAALATLNARRPGERYPFLDLCGAGVVFKLVQGLIARRPAGVEARGLSPGVEKWFLDLVAIATIADMVPLRGENRALVHFGLKVLRQTRRPGLLALFKILRLRPGQLTEEDVAFMVGPRINAASRMAHAELAFRLLGARDAPAAEALAQNLETQNRRRRKLVEEILERSEDLIPAGEELPAVLVLGQRDWSPAVLGLAATRLVERYRRPVFLWGEGAPGLCKGSCRSDGSVNLVELMMAANQSHAQKNGGSDLFLDLGGHAAAGGFSVRIDQVDALGRFLADTLATVERQAVVAELVLDAKLTLAEVTPPTYQRVASLAPFGAGNPRPVFLLPDLAVVRARTFGNGGTHLALDLDHESHRPIGAVGFFRGGGPVPPPGARIWLAAKLEEDYFQGRGDLRLRIVDWRPAE